jgi:protein O-GlcNAc transferase
MVDAALDQKFQEAQQLQVAGRLGEAEKVCRDLLVSYPEQPDVLHLLGMIVFQAERLEEATELVRRAVALKPMRSAYHTNLGVILATQGRNEESAVAFRQSLALKPGQASAWNNLGNVLRNQGKLDDAIAAYRQVLNVDINNPEVHYNLANVLSERGDYEEAISGFRRSIALRPGYAEAYNNLGGVLHSAGQLDEAIIAFDQSLRLNPNNAKAHYNKGFALQTQGRADEALRCYRRALALRPDYAEAYNNLGNVLHETGELDEAMASYQQAIVVRPGHAKAHGNIIQLMNYRQTAGAAVIAEEVRRWNEQHVRPLKKLIVPHDNDPNPNRRLRIGYVSSDFRDHVSAFFLDPLLRSHDHQKFEIFCYSQAPSTDGYTQRFTQYADRWRDTLRLGEEQLAEQIRRDRIDILVDLKLHTQENRLLVFARKPAPIQLSWLGYPGSSGVETIDYRFTDRFLESNVAASNEGEQPIVLPDCFWCYDPLASEPDVNELPALAGGPVTFGCLNSFSKVSDKILDIWIRLLLEYPNSRLMMLVPQGPTRQKLVEKFAKAGVDVLRLELLNRHSRPDYLRLYHRVDLALDTLPYNGHTTTLDALWMGVPVVTLPGDSPVGRGGLSILSNLGMTDWIAGDADQYIAIAKGWAGDLPKLAEVRRGLRPKLMSSPLTDAKRFAGNFESAYREIWKKWCAQQTTPQATQQATQKNAHP